MSVQTSPEPNNISTGTKRPLFSSRFYSVVVFLLATVAMFLLGCFVIGPWARNHNQSVETSTAAPVVMPDDNGSPVPVPANPPKSFSDDGVTITEVLPEEPSSSSADAHSKTASIPDSTSASSSQAASSSPQPSDKSSVEPEKLAPQKIEPPSTDTSSSPVSETGHQPLHRVRAGVFADRANADALADKLSASGFSPSVYSTDVSGRRLFTVQLGAFKKRESAEELANSLRASGFEATIVTEK